MHCSMPPLRTVLKDNATGLVADISKNGSKSKESVGTSVGTLDGTPDGIEEGAAEGEVG
jgi:hypothetical protein